jgi:hypothetical protein
LLDADTQLAARAHLLTEIDGSFGSAPGYQRLITHIFVDIVQAVD